MTDGWLIFCVVIVGIVWLRYVAHMWGDK